MFDVSHMTLLDLRDEAPGFRMSLSHVAARQEVRALLQAIGLPDNPATEATGPAGAPAGGDHTAQEAGERRVQG